jgi:flavocytochrome c
MADKNSSADVTIIGGGGAGMAAALEASKQGAKVQVFEREESLGGAAIISGGGCCIAGSPLQESKGIRDNADQAFEDWVKWGRGEADEAWARFYLDHTLHELYFWAEKFGVKWAALQQQEGNRVPRWHQPENAGLGLTSALIQAAQADSRIHITTGAGAVRIVADNGRVKGVVIEDAKSGDRREFPCKTLVVTTGGFNGNLDMILEIRPDLAKYRILEGGAPCATGAGHKLLREIGGYFTHTENIWCYVYATPDYRDAKGRRGLIFRQTPGYIWVNQQGRRFHNEFLVGGASATPAVMAQNPPHAWAVLDSAMAAAMEVADPYYREGAKVDRNKVQELLNNSPYIKKADTLAELGRKIEVDLAAFTATIERYNRAVADGLEREPEFGKPLKQSKKFNAPPYYAMQLFPLARKNFGGVKTDLKCRALNKYFEPIAALYAAGEVAGMAGGHINGRAGLEGTMLGPSLFSGRVAGAWAAAEAGFGAGFVGKANRS